MSNGTSSRVGLVALAAIVSASLSACDPGVDAQGGKHAHGRSPAQPTALGPPQSLRALLDAASGKLWALHADRVDVHDPAEAGGSVTAIRLPGWASAAEPYACPPDLALVRGGDVLVTSNVTPAIWRIDPATLAVTRHDLAVHNDRNRDIGFSRMHGSARGDALFAAGALDNSLWLIDSSLERAQPIELNPSLPQGCVLSIRPGSSAGSLCVQTEQGEWIVTLAADLRSGEAQPVRLEGAPPRTCRVSRPGSWPV
jgi:hypothetical protein